MYSFSVHEYLQQLGSFYGANVTRENNISRLTLTQPDFSGDITGIQIDKGLVLTLHDLEINSEVSFSSIATHELFKISFVLEGHYHIENDFIKNEEVKAGCCRGLFYRQKSVTRVKPSCNKILTIDISIRTALLRKHLHSITKDPAASKKIAVFLNSNENMVFKSQITAPVYQLLASIKEVSDGSNLIKRLNVNAKVFELLSELANECGDILDTNTKPVLVNSLDMQKIIKAKEYLDEHMSDATTLRELARIVCLNEFKLKKGFKEYYNTTIHSYVVDQRLCASCKMLKERNCPISEIAFEVGYQCPSKYIHSFRKKYGVTPGKFRKSGSVQDLAHVA